MKENTPSDQPLRFSLPGIATKARVKSRHRIITFSFLGLVVFPCLVAGWYLFSIANDQFASRVGFSVRTEETGSAVEILGGITELSGSSTSDTDILYEFIQSQQLVRRVDQLLDLRTIYHAPKDPIFGISEVASIEDLVDYWQRVVKVFYDSSSKLIEIRVTAFQPEDARAISTAIFDESTAMINELSAIARSDTTRYAKEELDVAVERLRSARQTMTEFRIRTQIVDPEADIQGRMGVLNSLQAQLATALIELDILLANTQATDPRVRQAESKIVVIERRIDDERAQFSGGDDNGNGAYATVVGEYENLAVNLEFAETSYVTSLAAYDAAQAEARRQSRYLAAFVKPTLAESPEYPKRWTIFGVLFGFLLIGWATIILIYYSLRDRR